MTEELTKKFTNNTLEEDLNSVAEEQDAKYRAYVKISDLQRQLNTAK